MLVARIAVLKSQTLILEKDKRCSPGGTVGSVPRGQPGFSAPVRIRAGKGCLYTPLQQSRWSQSRFVSLRVCYLGRYFEVFIGQWGDRSCGYMSGYTDFRMVRGWYRQTTIYSINVWNPHFPAALQFVELASFIHFGSVRACLILIRGIR